jgi:hypothetical protein
MLYTMSGNAILLLNFYFSSGIVISKGFFFVSKGGVSGRARGFSNKREARK